MGNDLAIEYQPIGNNGTVTMTATLAGETLAAEKLDILKSKARDGFAERLCEDRPGIDRLAVNTELLKIATEVADRAADQSSSGGETDNISTETSDQLLSEMDIEAIAEAKAMLDHRYLLERVIDDVSTLGVAGEREMIAMIYLIGTSRLLDKPLAAIVHGPTSSGKSFAIRETTRLFPPEAVIHAHQITPQALFYLSSGSLEHRFVVTGERSRITDDKTAEATRALREMLSDGRLSKMLPITKPGHAPETVLIEQEGPIAYVESTTLSKIDEEDANRCVHLFTDERPEQTGRIIEVIAAQHSGTTPQSDHGRIIQRHHALQRLLKPHQVVIRYAERIGELFTTDRVEARRAFPQVISMIEASAILHQHQRQKDEQGRLVANEEDYQLVHHLMCKPLGHSLGGALSDPARRFYERLSQAGAVAGRVLDHGRDPGRRPQRPGGSGVACRTAHRQAGRAG